MRQIVLLLTFLPMIGIAQQSVTVKHMKISDHWTVDPRAFQEDFSVELKNIEPPLPGGDLNREEMRALKRRMNELYPRTTSLSSTRGDRSTDTLTIGQSFPADFFLNQAPIGGGTPNDNTLAISDDGKLISSWNSQLWAYDIVADTYLFAYPNMHPSFNQFLNIYNDTAFSLFQPFDPKLLYDPTRQRFIMLFMTGRNPSNSATIVSFSTSTDPKDPWHAYRLPGNPLTYDTWSDYPQIAINENSFYLTLNQLYPDSGWVEGFAETLLWQMDLDEAFAGEESVTTKLWTGFTYEGKNIRYLHPVKTHMGPQGDSMYLVANRPFVETNDTFFIVRVEGDADDPITAVDVKMTSGGLQYGHPPYAKQSGGNQEFWTNDARVLGAVRMGKEIHITGNTVDFNSGKATIYHGKIADAEAPTVVGTIISDPVKELGFPNLDFIGVTPTDRDVVIFANHTGTTIHPGNSAIYIDHDGNYGPLQTVAKGETYVDGLPWADERWGDYTGLQRKFNETAEVWVAGYWGFASQRPGIYISQLQSPKHGPLSVENEPEQASITIYPNPTMEWVQFQFDLAGSVEGVIEIRDVQGRYVATIGKGLIKSGANQLGFDVSSLAAGTYVVQVKSAEGIHFTEKFIKQ